MKRQSLFVLALLPFIASSCSSVAEKTSVDITMVNQFGDEIGEGEYTDSCEYSDEWFFEDSSELNYDLALLSAMTGGASYSNSTDTNGTKITSLLTATGYSAIAKNYYYENALTLQDSLGVVIGHKKIKGKGGEFTLLAIFPRNAGYDNEWAGNFNIATDGTHTGFMLARDEMLRFTKQYIINNEITGALKVWTAGYSRGAAAVNLFSAFLADETNYLGSEVSLDESNIYAYTVGTPLTVTESIDRSVFLSVSGPRSEPYHDTSGDVYAYVGEGKINPLDEKYNYIHNFVAKGDIVAKLPPSEWGYTRFGKTEDVIYGSEEMVSYLKTISPTMAEYFESGRSYVTNEPTSTFNFNILEIVDAEALETPDNVLNDHIGALVDLVPNTEKYATEGYKEALSAIVATFGTDYTGFVDGVQEMETSDLLKTAILTFISYLSEKLNLSESEAIERTLMDLMDILGKTIEDRSQYNDQKFLKDLFDLIINDYQTSEAARIRINTISSALPAPYGAFLLGLVDYAKTKETTVTVFDDFLLLFSNYCTDNKDNEEVKAVIEALAGKIPEEQIPTLAALTGKTYDDEHYPTPLSKAIAILQDLFYFFVNGKDESTPEQYRYLVVAMIVWFGLSSYPKVQGLIMNGMDNGYGTKIESEPSKLSDFVDEFLTLTMPEDEETHTRKTFKELADEGLLEILEKGRTAKNSTYIDEMISHLDIVKEIAITVFTRQIDTFSLKEAIDNAVTFYSSISFLAPAHFYQMYVCYLKTKITK